MNTGIIVFFTMLVVILIFRLPVGIGMLPMGVIYMLITGQNLKILHRRFKPVLYQLYSDRRTFVFIHCQCNERR